MSLHGVNWCCGRGDLEATDSSDSGVIFFSSISSSAKFFLYFSQFEPVAEGYAKVSRREAVQAGTNARRMGAGIP
jgi:hypothetical protein